MPFGCLPIRQTPIRFHHYTYPNGSPMPFGCLPIRQLTRSRRLSERGIQVSNAFRLSAYPAVNDNQLDPSDIAWVSNAFRLSAYPADRVTG